MVVFQNWTAHEYLKNGIDKSKLMIGIPTYSHAYKLISPKIHGLRSLAIGRGECEGASYSCVSVMYIDNDRDTCIL